MKPTRITKTFSECEHQGDLQNYVHDIVKCGGRIISAVLNDEETETGTVEFEVDDPKAFWKAFAQTDSHGF